MAAMAIVLTDPSIKILRWAAFNDVLEISF
jgi:hypothetical protein